MNIEHGITYLQESLSNYEDDIEIIARIRQKIDYFSSESNLAFIQTLDEEEVGFLDKIIKEEIHYAHHAHDDVRARELTSIYTLLI